MRDTKSALSRPSLARNERLADPADFAPFGALLTIIAPTPRAE